MQNSKKLFVFFLLSLSASVFGAAEAPVRWFQVKEGVFVSQGCLVLKTFL